MPDSAISRHDKRLNDFIEGGATDPGVVAVLRAWFERAPREIIGPFWPIQEMCGYDYDADHQDGVVVRWPVVSLLVTPGKDGNINAQVTWDDGRSYLWTGCAGGFAEFVANHITALAIETAIMDRRRDPVATRAGLPPWPLIVADKSGANPGEWPEHLRVQERPAALLDATQVQAPPLDAL